MKSPRYANDARGILIEQSDGVDLYLDHGEIYDAIIAAGSITPYVPAIIDPLNSKRAAMVCSPAQMRIALHRSGRLSAVQAIISADPEAKIAWEYAASITRQSALVGMMKMKPEEIDSLFDAAMGVTI